jgi:hypothetical protein
MEAIELKQVMWNYRATEGQWCKAPYPDHPNGCPNFPKCIEKNQLEDYSPTQLQEKLARKLPALAGR